MNGSELVHRRSWVELDVASAEAIAAVADDVDEELMGQEVSSNSTEVSSSSTASRCSCRG